VTANAKKNKVKYFDIGSLEFALSIQHSARNIFAGTQTTLFTRDPLFILFSSAFRAPSSNLINKVS
jgi:hypothetical protein